MYAFRVMLIFYSYNIYHIFLLIKKLVDFLSPAIFLKLFITGIFDSFGFNIYSSTSPGHFVYSEISVNFKTVARSR